MGFGNAPRRGSAQGVRVHNLRVTITEDGLSEPVRGSVDETLVAAQLRLSPTERLMGLEPMYQWSRELQQAGSRARGELT